MSQLLLLSEKLYVNENSEGEDMQAGIDQIENYKGIYHDEEEDESTKNYEGGAHFPYRALYLKLEEIKKLQQIETSNATEIYFKKNKLVNSRESAIIAKGMKLLIQDQNNIKAPQIGKSFFKKIINKKENHKDDSRSNSTTGKNLSKLKTSFGKEIKKIKLDTKGDNSVSTEKLCHSNYIGNPSINFISSGEVNLNIIMNNNYFMSLNNLNSKSRNVNKFEKPCTGVQINNISFNLKNLEESKDNSSKKVLSQSPKVFLQKKNPSLENRSIKQVNLTKQKEESIKEADYKIMSKNIKKINNHYISYSNEVLGRNESKGRLGEFSLSNKRNNNLILEKRLKNGTLLKSNLKINSEKLSKQKVLLHEKDSKTTATIIRNSSGNQTTINNKTSESSSNFLKLSSDQKIIRDGVITTYNTKLGRNKPVNLNPHNTNCLGLKLVSKYKNDSLKVSEEILSPNIKNEFNSNILNSQQCLAGISESIINYDTKLKESNCQDNSISQCIHNLESNREKGFCGNEIHISNYQVIGLPHEEAVPIKTGNLKLKEKLDQKSPQPIENSSINNSLYLSKNNDRKDSLCASNVLLNEIISNITYNKNQDKSRNLQRNNLTSTKSNILSSEKAQSIQSGSYQKNLTFTQLNSNSKCLNSKIILNKTNIKKNSLIKNNNLIGIKQDTKNKNLIHKTALDCKASFAINKSFNKSKIFEKKITISIGNKLCDTLTKNISNKANLRDSNSLVTEKNQEKPTDVLKNEVLKISSKVVPSKFNKDNNNLYNPKKIVSNISHKSKFETGMNSYKNFGKLSCSKDTKTSTEKNSKFIITSHTLSSASTEKKLKKTSNDNSVKNL